MSPIHLLLFLGDYSLKKNHFSSTAFMKFHLGFWIFFFPLSLTATFLCFLHLLYFFHCYHWAHCTDDGDDDIFIIIDTINLFISIPSPPPLSIIASLTHLKLYSRVFCYWPAIGPHSRLYISFTAASISIIIIIVIAFIIIISSLLVSFLLKLA